jgi:hypothetical protein
MGKGLKILPAHIGSVLIKDAGCNMLGVKVCSVAQDDELQDRRDKENGVHFFIALELVQFFDGNGKYPSQAHG